MAKEKDNKDSFIIFRVTSKEKELYEKKAGNKRGQLSKYIRKELGLDK